MHLLDTVSRKHYFKVLLHEKPYALVNGSGKHNNWSLATNTGVNLLTPGKTPLENLRFITMLANILKALHTHEALVRASVASASNDLRLGAHEAPPAIISAFIGEQLTRTLDEIENMPSPENINNGGSKGVLSNIPKIPEILLDNTDRNRTSPFAFTGNKFEFRAVGSLDNSAKPMFILNTIVADQFNQFYEEVRRLMDTGTKTEDAIFKVVKDYIKSSKAIRFEGNSYSDEWKEEAKKRGLSNTPNTPDAIKAYLTEPVIALFERNEVLNKRELEARYEIKLDNYISKVQIESRLVGDLSINHIIPTAIKYQNTLIENERGLKNVLDHKTYVKLSRNQVQNIKEISEHISMIRQYVEEMTNERKIANLLEQYDKKAHSYCYKIKPYF
ncbi:MAG: glutamine synthetase type III, partial [Bacteroidales bacterium]|nr:glutamine synthetase type III [Bacteroidales bacterium]